jgi:ATP-dependent DNA helicase RecG
LQNNVAEVQIIGKIINVKTVEFGKGRKRLVATFVVYRTDGTGFGFKDTNGFRNHLKINESV